MFNEALTQAFVGWLKEHDERVKADILKGLDYRSPEDLLDIDEVADVLKIRKDKDRWQQSVYNFVKKSKMPYYKVEGIGNRYKYKDLMKALENSKIERR